MSVRQLEVHPRGGSGVVLRVGHFHYRAWPDFGVPSNTEDIRQVCQEVGWCSDSGPVVVHCSAGVGRTGGWVGTWMGG